MTPNQFDLSDEDLPPLHRWQSTDSVSSNGDGSSLNTSRSSRGETMSISAIGTRIQHQFRKWKKKDSTGECVDDLTKQMAELWWPQQDSDEKICTTQGENTGEEDENDGNQMSSFGDNARNLASMAIQTSMERIWAKELYEMNPKEREDITNEIHGVRSRRAIHETPEFIQENVQALRDHIDWNIYTKLDNGDSIVPPVTKDAYKSAISFAYCDIDSCYVRTHSFLLKLLRAELFDIERAALRYFRWLDLRFLLFGDVGLQRNITLEDLTKREMRYLKKGQMQLLPCRDRAGRRVYVYAGHEDKEFSVYEKYRVKMYFMDVLSEDEASQKLGFVHIISPKIDPGSKPFGNNGMALKTEKIASLGGLSEHQLYHKYREARPLRASGLHCTGPDTLLYNIGKALILILLGKEDRKIVRFHGGSQMEVNYSLKSFGIPPHEIPLTESGQIKTKNISKFIAARRSIERWKKEERWRHPSQEVKMPGIECPEFNAIIFGNGAQFNLANLEFRNILKVMEADREEKIFRSEDVPNMRDFIHNIIRVVEEHNLQYVKIDKDTSLFVEIKDQQELYTKISQALRDQRKRSRLEQQQNNKKQRPHHQEQVQADRVFSGRNGGSDGGSIMGWDAANRFQNSSSHGCCSMR